jgi:hypothetical protein
MWLLFKSPVFAFTRSKAFTEIEPRKMTKRAYFLTPGVGKTVDSNVFLNLLPHLGHLPGLPLV